MTNQLDAPFRAKNRKTNKIKDQVKAGQIEMPINKGGENG